VSLSTKALDHELANDGIDIAICARLTSNAPGHVQTMCMMRRSTGLARLRAVPRRDDCPEILQLL
jgi:hypothetical protein